MKKFLIPISISILIVSILLAFNIRNNYKFVEVGNDTRQMYINYLTQDIDNVGDLCYEDAKQLLEDEMDMSHYTYVEGNIDESYQVAYSVSLYRYVKIDLNKCSNVEEYTFVLCHELCHIKYFTGNEIYTQFLTFRTLYESDNQTLKTIGKWFGVYALNRCFITSYDCSKLIIDYLGEVSNA